MNRQLQRFALGLTVAIKIFPLVGAEPADTRAAFLRLLDRPRVELAAEAKAPVGTNGLRTVQFSFAAEAGVRVPG